VLHDQEEAHVE
jgi:hypothetical protein